MEHHLHDPPHHDPSLALTRAERDGLLRYAGYTGAGFFDVIVAGNELSIASAKVSQLIRTLQLLQQLAERGIPVRVRDVHESGWSLSCYRSEVSGLEHDSALPWLNGYAAAWTGTGSFPASTFAEIRRLLTAATDGDRSRLVLLGLMHGRRGVDVSNAELAKLTGQTKKTIVTALKFGSQIKGERLDRLMTGLGFTWADPERRSGVAGMRTPEMPGITRLREIMDAEDSGWIRYVDTEDPSEARRLTSYRLAIGETVHQVPADELHDWLGGVAFCRQDGAGGTG